MKKFITLSCAAMLCVSCSSAAPTTPSEEAKVPEEHANIVVATSFYPLTHFVEQVGGDVVDVQQIAAPGADPHSYEPTARQVQQIFESDFLISNGAGQDPYADRIRHELEGSDVRVLLATEMVERMEYEEEDHDMHHDEHSEEEHEDEHHDTHEEHDDEHEEHDDHHHGEWDPHVWLDPLRAVTIVETIATELAAMRPEHAEEFRGNAAGYITQLRSLDEDMRAGLADCQLDAVIVSHDAYRYLAHRYNFQTLEIAGLSPSAEPSPARLAELARIAKQEGIGHVFFETQVSPALSETLAAEIGAETLVLHSIEALTQQERSEGKTYIDVQRANLENLRTALQCS